MEQPSIPPRPQPTVLRLPPHATLIARQGLDAMLITCSTTKTGRQSPSEQSPSVSSTPLPHSSRVGLKQPKDDSPTQQVSIRQLTPPPPPLASQQDLLLLPLTTPSRPIGAVADLPPVIRPVLRTVKLGQPKDVPQFQPQPQQQLQLQLQGGEACPICGNLVTKVDLQDHINACTASAMGGDLSVLAMDMEADDDFAFS